MRRVQPAIRASWSWRRTFVLLAVNNLFVGGMVGLERTVLPLPADGAGTSALLAAVPALVIGFGASKALLNLLVGGLADRFGRRRVLLAGWLLAAPIPWLLAGGESGALSVTLANILLGANQGLAWSMTLNMMIDLAPARSRGLTAGINEFSGYSGVALLALLTGLVAGGAGAGAAGGAGAGAFPWFGPWPPDPFALGYLLVAVGLASALLVPETRPASTAVAVRWEPGVGLPGLLGAATNLKDGLVWLALPLLMAGRGFDLAQTGVVTALYPGIWAAGQLLFGAVSDRVGRRELIAFGLLLQGAGLLTLGSVHDYRGALLSATLLGLGTGMAYPTLLAYVSDRAAPERRATALGIYRFFRDGGYVLGAGILLFGVPLAGAAMTVGAMMAMLAVIAWKTL
ncbi:MAG: MFS transporter [Trueperaceae bacterium]